MAGEQHASRLVRHWRLLGAACRDGRLARTDAAVLWSVLQMINNSTGIAFTSLSTVADKAGVNARTAPRALRRLCGFGYLVKDERRGKNGSSIYLAGASTDELVSGESVTDESATDGLVPFALTDSSEQQANALTSSSDIPASKNIQPQVPASKAVDHFAAFYDAYPKKVGRPTAEAVWKRKKLDVHADVILADIKASTAPGGRWSNTDKKFIKDPERYLKGEHWADEWAAAQAIPLTGLLPRDARTEDELEANNLASLARFTGGQAWTR